MTREGSCRERGGRRVPVLGDDSHPPHHYLLPLFSGFCVCTHVGCLFTFQVVETSSLSWSTRIKGFAACFVAGIVCSLLVRRPSPPPGSSRGPGRRRGSSGGEGHRSSAVLMGLCLPGESSALGAQEGAVPVRGVLHLWEHRIHWKVTALHQLGPSSPGGKAARLAARVSGRRRRRRRLGCFQGLASGKAVEIHPVRALSLPGLLVPPSSKCPGRRPETRPRCDLTHEGPVHAAPRDVVLIAQPAPLLWSDSRPGPGRRFESGPPGLGPQAEAIVRYSVCGGPRPACGLTRAGGATRRCGPPAPRAAGARLWRVRPRPSMASCAPACGSLRPAPGPEWPAGPELSHLLSSSAVSQGVASGSGIVTEARCRPCQPRPLRPRGSCPSPVDSHAQWVGLDTPCPGLRTHRPAGSGFCRDGAQWLAGQADPADDAAGCGERRRGRGS